MREFINIITESRGLGARRPGEEFISATNPEDKIYVNSVTFYPEGKTNYDSYEEMVGELKRIVNAIPNAYVDLLGKFSQTDLAFGIAIFDRLDKTHLAFVKPYKSIHLDPSQNNWSNQTGIPGFKYNSKAAAKTQAGLTPQDILTKQSNLTPSDIVHQVASKFGDASPLTSVVKSIAAGQKLPISITAPDDMSFTAFRDYFAELLHPIALHTGNYVGNAGDAASKFLGVGGFAGTSINFGKDKTEGLSDSILISSDGKKIKVSSKGAKGATASAKNLVDAAQELEISNPALLKKHKEVIDLIHSMARYGQTGAPLVLGVQYKIIEQSDADQIMDFKKLPLQTFKNGLHFLSPRLTKLYKERNTDNPDSINLHFHCLAAVAHKVADYINKNTNFSAAAGEILNNGALVQVYTKATESAGTWTLDSFNTVWPSKTITGVVLSASKTYYSTGVKGNFTFKILQNGAKDVPDERSEEPALEPIETPNAITGKRVNIRPSRSEPENSSGPGRERR